MSITEKIIEIIMNAPASEVMIRLQYIKNIEDQISYLMSPAIPVQDISALAFSINHQLVLFLAS